MSKKAMAEALGVSRPTLDRYIGRGWVSGRPDGASVAMRTINEDLALVAPATPAAAAEIALNGTFSIRAGLSVSAALRPGTLALVAPTSLELHVVTAIEVLWQQTSRLAMPSTTSRDIAADPSEWALRALEASLRVDRLDNAAPGALMVMRLGEAKTTYEPTTTVRRPLYEDAERVPEVTLRRGRREATVDGAAVQPEPRHT